MKNILSRILTLVGVLLCLATIGLMWQRSNPNRLSFEFEQVSAEQIMGEAKSHEVENEPGFPAGIRIKSIGVELPVVSSKMVNDEWETTDKGVSFLDTSAIPGQLGNSIMYGHNWNSLLGNLKKVSPGQKIEIIDKNGLVSEFIVETVQEVDPINSDILADTNDKRLTLYTCSGFLDSKRLVVTAFLATQ